LSALLKPRTRQRAAGSSLACAATTRSATFSDLKAAKGAGKANGGLANAQNFQRKAQFYLDFVEAENSTGFHAPPEAARILGESIDLSRQGQIVLRDGQAASRP
jgi:nitrite reductase (cytochrome c-552)